MKLSERKVKLLPTVNSCILPVMHVHCQFSCFLPLMTALSSLQVMVARNANEGRLFH